MIESKYWKDFYKSHKFEEPSQFAQFCLPKIDGDFVDLGCGDGRDLYYFLRNDKHGYGVDASTEDVLIIKQTVEAFIKENPSPENVYTRFFWHAIPHETQQAILYWAKNRIFIEARTDKDKPKNIYGKHDRNLVNVDQLGEDLGLADFKVTHLQVGHGMATFFDEDPHIVRVIAEKA